MKKYWKELFLLGFVIVNLPVCADLPQPYASVAVTASTPYFVQDAYVYYSLISENQSSVVVDVESQDGGVARFVAQQKETLPSISTIYSINPWRSWDPSQKHLYQRFLSNVVQENTADFIIPIRMSSNEAAEGLNINADFISLVGGNDEKIIYRDILAWYPHLTDKGIIAGNNWNERSVQIGVTRAAQALDLNLNVNANVWYFQKQSQ